MTVEQWAAIITALAVFITANVGFLTLLHKVYDGQKSLKKQQEKIQHEVTNSHSVNLRDDMDDKHAELMIILDKLSRHVSTLENTVKSDREWGRGEARNLWSEINKLRQRGGDRW